LGEAIHSRRDGRKVVIATIYGTRGIKHSSKSSGNQEEIACAEWKSGQTALIAQEHHCWRYRCVGGVNFKGNHLSLMRSAKIEGLACGGPQGAFSLARSARREEIKKRRPLDNGTIFEWGYLWVMFMAKFAHQVLGNGKNYADTSNHLNRHREYPHWPHPGRLPSRLSL